MFSSGRLGKFSLSKEILVDNNAKDFLSELFSKCIILSAQGNFVYDRIDYIAYCDDFENVKFGGDIPTYKPTFRQIDKNRTCFAEWVRKKR